MPRNSDTMPATAVRMPLRTSQDAPWFLGAADDLARYVAEVESLCKKCQRSTDANLIKWAVYYMEGPTWDTWAITRDALPKPKTWDGFQSAICDVYPQHEAHTQSPLHASLPSLAAPITPWSPQPPAPALTLSLAALDALLSPALSNMPEAPGLPQLSPATAPLSPVQVRLPHTPAPALRSPSILPAPVSKPLHVPAIAQLLSDALHLPPSVEASQLPTTIPLPCALSLSRSPSPLLCHPPVAVVAPALKSPCPAAQQMLPAAPIVLPLPPPTQAPILLPPPLPDEPQLLLENSAVCSRREGLVTTPVVTCAVIALPMPAPHALWPSPCPPALPPRPAAPLPDAALLLFALPISSSSQPTPLERSSPHAPSRPVISLVALSPPAPAAPLSLPTEYCMPPVLLPALITASSPPPVHQSLPASVRPPPLPDGLLPPTSDDSFGMSRGGLVPALAAAHVAPAHEPLLRPPPKPLLHLPIIGAASPLIPLVTPAAPSLRSPVQLPMQRPPPPACAPRPLPMPDSQQLLPEEGSFQLSQEGSVPTAAACIAKASPMQLPASPGPLPMLAATLPALLVLPAPWPSPSPIVWPLSPAIQSPLRAFAMPPPLQLARPIPVDLPPVAPSVPPAVLVAWLLSPPVCVLPCSSQPDDEAFCLPQGELIPMPVAACVPTAPPLLLLSPAMPVPVPPPLLQSCQSPPPMPDGSMPTSDRKGLSQPQGGSLPIPGHACFARPTVTPRL
ncbi:hypothetical protein AX14_001998 [Amanita brunnescens Koide BX004]|nr:hypothetical protein AX14_001998 [Amanita brunnescens Koide BX004]